MPIIDPFDQPASPSAIVDPFEQPAQPQPNEGPFLEQGEPPSLWEQAKSLFRDPVKEGAQAAQALVDSELLGVTPSTALSWRDSINEFYDTDPERKAKRDEYLRAIQKFNDTGVKDGWIEGTWKKIKQVPLSMQVAAGRTLQMLEENNPALIDAYLAERSGLDEETLTAFNLIAERKEEQEVRSIGKGFAESAQKKVEELEPLVEPGSLQDVVGKATTSVVQNLAYMLPGLATKNPRLVTLMLMGGHAGAEGYGKQREGGSDPKAATLAALGYGLSEALTEFIPVGQYLQPGKAFVRRLVEAEFTEIPTEVTNTLVQAVIDKSTIRPDMTLQEALEQVQETIQVTAVSTLGLSGLSHTAHKVLARQLPPDLKDDFTAAKDQALKEGATPQEAVSAGLAAVRETPEGQAAIKDFVANLSPQEVAELGDVPDADIDTVLDAPEEELDATIDRVLNRPAATEGEQQPRLAAFRAQVGAITETPEETAAVSAILEARARAVGMTPDEYLEYHGIEVELAEEGEGAAQANKAQIEFTGENRTIIRAFEAADVSSMVHELGHVFRRDLGGEDLATAEAWAGAQDGQWTVEAEEKFARGFERYLADGQAPSSELQRIFEQFKNWLLEIYQSIAGSSIDINISPEMRGVFDRLLTETRQPEKQQGEELLAQTEETSDSEDPIPGVDIFSEEEIMAAELPPEEAMAFHARISAEIEQRAEELLTAQKEKEQKKYLRESYARAKKEILQLPDFVAMAEAVKRGGINLEQLSRDYGAGTIKALLRKRPGLLAKAGKIVPDEFADEYGYRSLDAMINAWLEIGTITEETAELGKQIYAEEYEQFADEGDALTFFDDLVNAEQKAQAEIVQDWRTAKRPAKGLKNVIKRITGQTTDGGKNISERVAMAIGYRREARAAKAGYRAGMKAGKAAAAKPPKESLKARVRRITGQEIPQGPMVSEYDAMKEVLRRVAQAARQFRKEGNREGALAERTRLKALFAAARQAQKTRQQASALRRKIKTLLKKTAAKRVAGKRQGKFTPEIQAVLDRLRAVSKLSRNDAEARLNDAMARWENEAPPPEIAMENHLLEMRAKIETMDDPEALQELYDELSALVNEGRMLRALADFNRQSEWQAWREQTIDELTGGAGLPARLAALGKRQFVGKSSLKQLEANLHTIGQSIVGWNDVMDMLSFKAKDTKPGESFISKNNNLLGIKNREKAGIMESMQAIHDAYKTAYGLTSNSAILKAMQRDNTEDIVLQGVPFQTVDGQDFTADLKFTRAELRKRAMELMDPTLVDRFGESMGYTEGTVAAIVGQLTPQDRLFVAAQLEFYQGYYEGVNEVFRKLYGVNLPFNELYSPIRAEGISQPVDSGPGEFLQEVAFRASAATAGSLKERTSKTTRIAQLSDLTVLQRHIIEMEHFKAWAEKVRDLNAVWKDDSVRTAVELNHGKPILGLVDNFIQDMAAGGMNLGLRFEALDKFRIRFTRAALAIQPDIAFGQLTSMLSFAEKMPVKAFVRNLIEFWKAPKENARFAEQSTSLQDRWGGRGFERDLVDVMKSEEYSQFAKHQGWLNMLMINIKLGDQAAGLWGGWAYYQWLTAEQGFTPEEAIAKVEEHMEQTMQSADIADQSKWQRAGSLGKLTTMFLSSPNQYLRRELAAIRNLAAGRISREEAAKIVILYHVVLPMLFQFVSDRFTWDADEQKRAALLGSLNGWFLIGDGLDWMLRKMLGMQEFDMEIPVLSLFHDLIKATALVDLVDLSTEEFMRALRGLASVVGVAAGGLPLRTAIDTITGVGDVLFGEYEKGLTEIMGWSPYKAKKLAND